MKAWAITHPGFKRLDNQDRYLIREYAGGGMLLAVADGMGGEAAGDLAAQMAVEGLRGLDPGRPVTEAGLTQLFRAACRKILCKAEANPGLEGMGTTLTAAFVAERRAVWAHVGDSRLYLWRRGELSQISRDHTAAAFMAEEGMLDREQARSHPARHMLLDCVGCGDCEPDSGTLGLRPGDRLLLATDGLHDRVPARTIAAVLGDPQGGLEQRLEALVQEALRAGGRDNITVVGLQI